MSHQSDQHLVEKRNAVVREALKAAECDDSAFDVGNAYIHPCVGRKSYVLVEIQLDSDRCIDTYGDECRFHYPAENWCNLFNTELDHYDLRCKTCLKHFPISTEE